MRLNISLHFKHKTHIYIYWLARKIFFCRISGTDFDTSGTRLVRKSAQGLFSPWNKLSRQKCRSPENIALFRLVGPGSPRMCTHVQTCELRIAERCKKYYSTWKKKFENRNCRCSSVILGRGKFNLFSAQSKALKLADRLQTVLGQPVHKVSGLFSYHMLQMQTWVGEVCIIHSSPFLFLYSRKPGLAKIITHLTNSSPFKKRFFNRSIRFPGSNFNSGETNGNVIGSERSKDLTAWARGLSLTSTTRSDALRL